MHKALGVCLGASTIKIIELHQKDDHVFVAKCIVEPHNGSPLNKYIQLLKEFDLDKIDYAAITGRKFKEFLESPSITEPEATENALEFLLQGKENIAQGALSLGSENFVLYKLNKRGHIIDVKTGNKCASGTGSFFLQQIGRMNLTLEEALENPLSDDPHKVSGRCSVFCKSDCTHALNKGIPFNQVVHGLCLMISEKVLELVGKMKPKNFILIGGVSKNRAVVEILKGRILNLTIPKEADYFEALGAAFYALKNKIAISNLRDIKKTTNSFRFLPPINKAKDLVVFGNLEKGVAGDGDECILGLDVGSTTTKAILLRISDKKILDSIYLRTNGNPVMASRQCYKKLSCLDFVKIIGLGVTGSGRYISALHASTDGVINEIISHATAAAFFDREVDTIFEIGGQDAKYTYLVNGVPADYAMNEACSAGTGSFLEEAARENMSIDYLDIASLALSSNRAPNFSDQCAAFIGSDIKNASQENLSKEEILAGLVYSICFNYLNKVKVNRVVGKKIFMQGGVCYNKAIPLAMANILQKKLIVPPEPGLMGAFGVALEVLNKINIGLMEKRSFNLKELEAREVSYGKSFRCEGGGDGCDRNCEINVIEINGDKYPFGGICDKYYNFKKKKNKSFEPYAQSLQNVGINHVRERQKKVYDRLLIKAEKEPRQNRKTIGISKAFLTNTLFPLFYNFFDRLGFDVVLPDQVDNEGIKRVSAALCYPAEMAHGYLMNLIKKDVDYIFLPHLVELYLEKSDSYQKEYQSTCFLMQSEPYFLKSSFKEYKDKFLMPILDFYKGWETQENVFASLALQLGLGHHVAKEAFLFALNKQREFFKWRKDQGLEILKRLKENHDEIGIVVFGRAYNAFLGDANMGIPEKFSSRGLQIIPFDFLPYEDELSEYKSCWASGQEIIKAASFVAKHQNLYGVYITNFSCGPDSFLITYFRDIMKTKPSLTLELDSHTADAGINTRVEAFLDIIERSRKLKSVDNSFTKNTKPRLFTPESITNRLPNITYGMNPDFLIGANNRGKDEIVFKEGKVYFRESKGNDYPLKNKRVKVVFPSMGQLGSEIIAAAFRGRGIRAEALPISDFSVLVEGRANTSGKECLPLILCCGGLMKYLKEREDKHELTAFFMPTTSGNCRFTQYSVYLNRLIEKEKFERVALLTLTSENSYGGFGVKASVNLIKAIIVSDVMDDIKNALNVLALDNVFAERIFYEEWQKIIASFESGTGDLYKVLRNVAIKISKIPLRKQLSEAKVVSILGEIFVRRDDFSCGPLIHRLNKKSIIAKRAPVMEWLYYVDFLIQRNLLGKKMKLQEMMTFRTKLIIQAYLERKIKKIMQTSGLIHYELINIEKITEMGKSFVNLELAGETILVIGAFFKEIMSHVHGAVSIGPFACLPSRVVEAILAQESSLQNKMILEKDESFLNLTAGDQLPFLALEVDGNPFPQIVEARIEAFCLQVDRLHKAVLKH
ncbi:hypothetical protein A2282_07100 [candidate division WOR-1 bacterium RIFOXYA12_FULL_36_13]|nr:MAG: hypothetical protein A2282_07100 [candidate division WOR-1 bacterium RIFOXYA12_FULL_36_13]